MMEEHPWKRFPKEDGVAKYLILGSLPPGRFTIKNNNSREKVNSPDLDFFYGSSNNTFWELISKTYFNTDNALKTTENIKNVLKENKFIISDIVLKATRKNANNAADSGLRNIVWSIEILKQIIEDNPIEEIYFTSMWVKRNFEKHILPHINLNKKINRHTLVSPSNAVNPAIKAFYNILPLKKDEKIKEYKLRYYKHFLPKLLK